MGSFFSQPTFGSSTFAGGTGAVLQNFESRTVLKSDLLLYVRRFLNDGGGNNIFSDAILSQFISEGEVFVNNKINLVWTKFSVAVTAGTAAYPLSTNVKRITRVTWLGRRLIPLSQMEISRIYPRYRSEQSVAATPDFFAVDADGYHTIRFLATPSITIPANDAIVFSDAGARSLVTVAGYMNIAESTTKLTIPHYYARPLIKEFVLWKAYRIEGKGYNSRASDYHKARFTARLEVYRKMNAEVYATRSRDLEPMISSGGYRIARPSLPANFGTEV
jgi:hypothetical protein